MRQLRHYCPSCRGPIYDGDCTGESGIYKSWNIPDLCEPCWLIEEEFVDQQGTNDHPDILAYYVRNNEELN